jgi:hypothetical protein
MVISGRGSIFRKTCPTTGSVINGMMLVVAMTMPETLAL